MFLRSACRLVILLALAFSLGGAHSAGKPQPSAAEYTAAPEAASSGCKSLPSCCTPTGRAAFLTSKQPAP